MACNTFSTQDHMHSGGGAEVTWSACDTFSTQDHMHGGGGGAEVTWLASRTACTAEDHMHGGGGGGGAEDAEEANRLLVKPFPGETSPAALPLTDVTTLGSLAAQRLLQLATDQVAGVPPLREDQVAGMPPLLEDQTKLRRPTWRGSLLRPPLRRSTWRGLLLRPPLRSPTW